MDIPEKIDWKREKICFLGASGELSIFVEALHNSCNFLGNFHGSEVVIYDNETSSTINKNLYELKHIEHRRAQSNLTRDKIFTIKSIDELPEFNNSLGLIPIITSDSYYKIYKEILIKKGYILGQNSFYYRDVYARIVKSIVGEVSLLRIDHAITFSCTLNCSHCNMYIPFIEPSHQHIETLLNDLDLLFRHVKHVGVFHIVGGEMTIHPKLNLYLEKLIYYRDRISQLWISTNGTVMPSKEILDKLKKLNPRLQISDYSEPIPKVASRVKKNIDQYHDEGFKPYVDPQKIWKDFGHPLNHNINFSNKYTFQDHFNECTNQFRGLHQGRVHYCNVAVGAQQIKNSVNDMKSSIDLNQPTEKISESLIELETRNIKYAPEHCNRCNGCNTQAEGELVSPSLQGKYN